MALKHQALIHILFLSFAPFLSSRQSHNIPFLQDYIIWAWQMKKYSKLVFHEENRVFLLNYNCSFLLLCVGILERDFYSFPKVLDTSTSKKKKPRCREQNNFPNESIPRKKHQCLSAYCTWVPHDIVGGRNSCWNECAQRGEQGTDLSACPGCQSESALMFCL